MQTVRSTYHVTPEILGQSRQKVLLRVLYSGGQFAILYFLLGLFWHGTGPHSVVVSFVSSIITGLLWAVAFYFLFTKASLYYELIVSDDSISAIYQFAEKSVRKGEIKTFKEFAGTAWSAAGLRISAFGRLGTFFRGYVWIPKGLPEYESLKSLAQSWKSNPGNQTSSRILSSG